MASGATAGKTVAIVQSSYIPWKGYFDLLRAADELILLDDVQYTRRDWRSRNRIKTPEGPLWLTIPVRNRGLREQRICDAEASDPAWPVRHWKAIRHAYARAPAFAACRDFLEALYLGCRETQLSRINRRFLERICNFLDFPTTISWSMERATSNEKTQRLVDLCQQAGAECYLSGPSAKSYLEESRFREAGLAVRWADYDGYPEYPQLYPPFLHQVSIIDLLMHCGRSAPRFMKCL